MAYQNTHTHSEQGRGSQGCATRSQNTSPPSADASPSLPGKTQGNSDTRIACTSVEAAPANKESKGYTQQVISAYAEMYSSVTLSSRI